MRIRGTKWWAGVAVAAGVLATAGDARAFYWYGWPGSKTPPPPTITPPGPPGPPPVVPPGNPPPVNPPGSNVPEPGTMAAALAGLGALAAARAARRRKPV